ncbi:synaptotagmin-like protein 4 isoform X4 [Patella vulgata]|uniref:synaptotagmin-like protein 4 isoform X4 n=1 Tax=Patella vulgata TaxID=6465 RepID=UPI00217F9828|nr:synaptotagmin-like protein 4 isoform X4 [Patella vulgata]
MNAELLDLGDLTEEEKLIILKVIKRDEDLRWEKTQQVNQMKNDIHNLRIQSVLRDGDDLNKMCARCHEQFGYIFNRGEVCPQCKFRVCNACREVNLSGTWLCTLCFKQMQLKLLTGEWMKPEEEKKDKIKYVGDIVKASIRKSMTSEGSLLGDSDGSPVSGRASGGRNDPDRAGYPKDSDNKKLDQLFESFRTNTADTDKNKSVTHVSCRRRHDSGSSSSSSEGVDGKKANLPKGRSVCDSITSSEPGLASSKPSSETESALNSPVLKSKDLKDTTVPKLSNGNLSKGKNKKQTGDTYSTSSEKDKFSSTESAQNSRQHNKQDNQTPVSRPASASPRRNVVLSPEHMNIHSRKSSGQSDTSSVSSARTASPATKMRLLDLASSRALERDTSDVDDRNSRSGQEGSDTDEIHSGHYKKRRNKHPNSGKLSVTTEGVSDEGTSSDNTPEHRASRQSRLSIPSLVLTSADDKADDDNDDNIDDLVASHRSGASSARSSTRGPFSLFSDSRESILSIYSDAGEINYGKIPVSGEVLLGVDYNYKTGALEIYVKQCKDLAPVDTKKNKSDPYIKTYLLPDKTRSGKRKTKIKKHTLNPTFDEVLRYNVSKSEVENRILWLTVWNNDKFGRNDFLGEVMLSLDCYSFGDPTPKWYLLQERLEEPQVGSLMPYKGDLVLSIKYVTPDQLEKESSKKLKTKKTKHQKGALQVMVKEARNLTAIRSNGTSDPFCKGYLLPDKHKSGKQKTPVVKKNCSPVWNYLFVFDDVLLDDLPERSLELTIWDHDTLSSNDFLGGIRFNLGMGIHEGKPVEWMDGRGEEIAIWQCMLDRPNTWIDACVNLRASMGKSGGKK